MGVLLCIVVYCSVLLFIFVIFVILLCIVVYICYIVVHCCILLLGQKNKLGLSLSRKKEFFGPKIGEKIENEVQKLTNFKEKRTFFWQKNDQFLKKKKKKKK